MNITRHWSANHRLTVFIFPNEHASGRTKDGSVTDEPRDKGSRTPKQHTLEEEKGRKKRKKKKKKEKKGKKKKKKKSSTSSSSNVALRPQRLYGLSGTWGPGRPPRLQFHTVPGLWLARDWPTLFTLERTLSNALHFGTHVSITTTRTRQTLTPARL